MSKSRKNFSPELRLADRLFVGFICFFANSLWILSQEKPSLTPMNMNSYIFSLGLIVTSFDFYHEEKMAEPVKKAKKKKKDTEKPKKKKETVITLPVKPVAVVQESKAEVIPPEVQERLNNIDSLLKETDALKEQINDFLNSDQSSKTAEKFREITSRDSTSKGKEKELRDSAYNRNQNATNVLRAYEEFNTQKRQLTTLLKQINADREAKAEKAKKMTEKQASSKPNNSNSYSSNQSPLVAYTAIRQVQVAPVNGKTSTQEFKKRSKGI